MIEIFKSCSGLSPFNDYRTFYTLIQVKGIIIIMSPKHNNCQPASCQTVHKKTPDSIKLTPPWLLRTASERLLLMRIAFKAAHVMETVIADDIRTPCWADQYCSPSEAWDSLTDFHLQITEVRGLAWWQTQGTAGEKKKRLEHRRRSVTRNNTISSFSMLSLRRRQIKSALRSNSAWLLRPFCTAWTRNYRH